MTGDFGRVGSIDARTRPDQTWLASERVQSTASPPLQGIKMADRDVQNIKMADRSAQNIKMADRTVQGIKMADRDMKR